MPAAIDFEPEASAIDFEPEKQAIQFEPEPESKTPPTLRAAIPAPGEAGPKMAGESRLPGVPQAFPAKEQAVGDLQALGRSREQAVQGMEAPPPTEAAQIAMLTDVAQPEAKITLPNVGEPGTRLGEASRMVTGLAEWGLNKPEEFILSLHPLGQAALAARYGPDIARTIIQDTPKAIQGDPGAQGRLAALGALMLAPGGIKRAREEWLVRGKPREEPISPDAAARQALSIRDSAGETAPPADVVAEPSTLAKLPEVPVDHETVLPGATETFKEVTKDETLSAAPSGGTEVQAAAETSSAPPVPVEAGGAPKLDFVPEKPAEPATDTPLEIVGMGQGPGARTVQPSGKPEPAESYEGTGLKNAIGDLERISYGFADRAPTEKQVMAQAWVKAGETLQRNTEAGRRLAASLESNPKRGLSGDESALLLRHKVNIENALNDAAERTITESDPALKAEANSDVIRLRDELNRFLDTIGKRGSEWGREGRWRQALAYEDYTFAAQERLLRASKGGEELTRPEHETLLHDLEERKAKAAELEQHLKEQEAKTAQSESARLLAEERARAAEKAAVPPHIKVIVDRIRSKIKQGADESRKFLAGAQFTLSPEVLYHMTRVAADNFLEIGENVAKWSEKMVSDIGERIRPYLSDLFDAGKKLAYEIADKESGGSAEKVKRTLKKVDKAAAQEKLLSALKESAKEGFKDGELGKYVKAIVKQVVEGGITEHDAVFEAAQKILKDNGVDLSKDEIRQAYSDYGKSTAAPTEPVKIRLSQLRGEAQKALGLKTVLEKQTPPEATGPRRVKVSDLYRRTVAQIHEAMKRLGVVAGDPARQLADALQARKTYRQNRIKDLRHEIATGERIVKGRSVPIEDAELKALDAEYQQLKREHAEAFPKQEPTELERIAAENKALDREIASLEQDIKEGNVLPKPARTKPITPELEAKRSRLEALREQRNELRELNEEFQRRKELESLQRSRKALEAQIEEKNRRLAAGDVASKGSPVNRPLHPELEEARQRLDEVNRRMAELRHPKKSPEELALQAFKTRHAARIADLQTRQANADFSPRAKSTRPPPALDREALRLQTELKAIEQRFAEGRLKNERARRKPFEKLQDTLVDWARGVKLLSPYVFPKLVVAGLTRIATNPLYRIAGQPLRLIPGLAEKAPVELGISIKAEIKNTAAILSSAPQAWAKLTKGKSNLDVLAGKLSRSREMSGLVGNSHGMIKEPVKQGAYARAIELRTEQAVRNGLDPQEPAVAATIVSSSLADAAREIFMVDNMATKYLIRLPVHALRQSGKTGAKTLANTIEFLLPIVNVPTNITIAAARLNPVIGFGEALTRIAKAAKEGELSDHAAKLSEADAESIARAFKYGMVGTFLAAYAWTNPDQFGGVFDEKGKRRDLKPGQIRIMGVTTYAWLGHTPELAFLNTVAAARRVYDRYYKKDPSSPLNASAEALAFSLMAPVKNLPFIDGFLRLFNSYQSPGQVTGRIVRDATLPTSGILKVFDQQERSPKTFWDEIKMGLPGLRQSVPVKRPSGTRPLHP